ncbi:MAG: EAL domain-containing protein [Xanthomonadaceae bacterium]|nr:EAL domain-containing protein [Xanthomonadaceae bacterium]
MTNPQRSGLPGRRRPAWLLVPVVALVIAAAAAAAVLFDGGPGSGFGYVAVMAAGASASLFVAGSRAGGRLRASWWLLGSASAAMSLQQVMLALAADGTTPVVLRLVPVVLAASALLTFPGTVAGLRGWVLLGLDGWLVGGSIFVVVWLAIVPPSRLVEAPADVALGSLWLVADLAVASTVLALLRRLPRGQRVGAGVIAAAGGLMALGDVARAVAEGAGWGAGTTAWYVAAWAGALFLAGLSPWISLDPFAAGASREPNGRAVRLPYLVACLAVAATTVAWALGRPGDPLLSVVVLTLLWSLVTSQVLLAVENRALVAQVSHQADMFRMRATQDGLTGLPNRSEFTGRVDSLLHSPGRGHVAVLFIDLDGFKDVNDSFGHAVGDELLIEAATRLAAEVRDSDVVARFGGDEFVALLSDCSDEEAVEVAERLRSSLSEPYRVGHRDVVVSASIGLARPDADDDAESALRNADLALYSAKESGRDRVSVYEPAMHASVLRRLDAAARLRHALAHDRLTLAYQPIVDLRTGDVYAMEALLRFDHEDFADWAVTEVIEAAEESGLIVPVGGWVLDAAVGRLGEWRRHGIDVRMNVNVSARQLEAGGDFAQQVENALICYGVPASSLTIEITEHQLVRDLEHSTGELERIRRRGVRVALDDFGTGYSSLSYLTRLPLDQIKIDKSFIHNLPDNLNDAVVVQSIITLARSLGISVVAEGVESEAQRVFLEQHGCPTYQGYLFSEPVPLADFEKLLARQ